MHHKTTVCAAVLPPQIMIVIISTVLGCLQEIITGESYESLDSVEVVFAAKIWKSAKPWFQSHTPSTIRALTPRLLRHVSAQPHPQFHVSQWPWYSHRLVRKKRNQKLLRQHDGRRTAQPPTQTMNAPQRHSATAKCKNSEQSNQNSLYKYSGWSWELGVGSESETRRQMRMMRSNTEPTIAAQLAIRRLFTSMVIDIYPWSGTWGENFRLYTVTM